LDIQCLGTYCLGSYYPQKARAVNLSSPGERLWAESVNYLRVTRAAREIYDVAQQGRVGEAGKAVALIGDESVQQYA
jgi:hypothetical protein